MAKHLRGGLDTEAALDGDPNTFWRAPDADHAVLEVRFATPVTFNRALTMEWLNSGQHVEKYAIEALVGGKWVAVYRGNAIGQRKIDTFPRTSAFQVRLNILSSAGAARIREFQLFDVPDGK